VNWILLNIPLATAVTAMVLTPLVLAIRHEPVVDEIAQHHSAQSGWHEQPPPAHNAEPTRELAGARMG
jgi:hypothetical protein